MYVTKILLFILLFAIIFVIKEAARFTFALFSKNETYRTNYKFEKKDFIHLACALAYIFTIIFTGFGL